MLGSVAACLATIQTGQAATFEWTSLRPVPVATGIPGPIDFAVEADGTLWWNEFYTGNVVRRSAANGSREVLFHAPPIRNPVERGLVGLALAPDAARNRTFYVYYTVADPERPEGGTNRLARIQDGNETLLLTTTAFRLHNGGRILVAPDGSLFLATGDNDRGHPAQDPKSLLGKILHLLPDGRPAPGNLDGYVYDLGHRNVYGLAYDRATNQLFATENNNAERDEVNLIRAGANYGWPTCEGNVYYDFEKGRATERTCDDARFQPPIGEYYPDRTAAPTGATVFRGALYWASWNEGSIHRIWRDPTNGAWRDTIVYRPGGRINDLESSPDGRSIYYSNWTAILRLDIPDSMTGFYTLGGPGAAPPNEPRAQSSGVSIALGLFGVATAFYGWTRKSA